LLQQVPFIVSWPGKVPQAKISHTGDIMSADWLPTVAALAGYTLPATTEAKLMGRDASYFILGGGAAARDPAGTAVGYIATTATTADSPSAAASAAARTGVPHPGPRKIPRMWDYRFDVTGGQACWVAAPRLAIRDPENPELKLLMNVDSSRVELYNLSSSTFESDSLATNPAFSGIVDRLKSTLLAWSQTTGPLGANSSAAKSSHMGCQEYLFPGTCRNRVVVNHSGIKGQHAANQNSHVVATLLRLQPTCCFNTAAFATHMLFQHHNFCYRRPPPKPSAHGVGPGALRLISRLRAA
jgi:hypothetical protein